MQTEEVRVGTEPDAGQRIRSQRAEEARSRVAAARSEPSEPTGKAGDESADVLALRYLFAYCQRQAPRTVVLGASNEVDCAKLALETLRKGAPCKKK